MHRGHGCSRDESLVVLYTEGEIHIRLYESCLAFPTLQTWATVAAIGKAVHLEFRFLFQAFAAKRNWKVRVPIVSDFKTRFVDDGRFLESIRIDKASR